MSGIDLSNDRSAHRARKLPVELQVEFAASEGTLATHEGPVSYVRDDALLTGTEGEHWPVPRVRFDATYEPVPPHRAGKPGRFRKRALQVWAKQMREPFAIQLGAGRGILRGEPGDWLLQYAPDELGVVSANVFARTYELLD